VRLPTGDPDAQSYGEVLRQLIDAPASAMGQIAPGDFTLLYALGETLPCARMAASEPEAQQQARAIDAMLDTPRAPLLGAIAHALERRPAAPATMAKLRTALRASAYCSLQSLAMASAPAEEARQALSSACWRLQAAAYERLQALGEAREGDRARLPYLSRR
jgi:hypothetical protein